MAKNNLVTMSSQDVVGEVIISFLERYEQLEAEKTEVSEQQKELKAEYKGAGLDLKAFNTLLVLRKKKPDDVAEEETILDLYKRAIGM